MFLDGYESLWGVSVPNAVEYGKLRRYLHIIVLGLIIVVILSAVMIMKGTHTSGVVYCEVMIMFAILVYVINSLFMHNELYRVYRFYKRYRYTIVHKETFRLQSHDLYRVMYRLRKSNIQESDNIDDYISLIYASCSLDLFYAESLAKELLAMSKENNQDGVLVELSYVSKGRKNSFVDLVVLKEEKSNECDFSGRTEEC